MENYYIIDHAMHKTPLLIVKLCLFSMVLSCIVASVSLCDVRLDAGRSFMHCVI